MSLKWLCRDLITGPYMALVLSERDFHKAMSLFNVPLHQRGSWIKSDGSDATAHTMIHPQRGIAVVVALRMRDGLSGVQVAGLLVHEAVHAFRHFCDQIGEERPSAEFEAYAIQAMAQRLMESFVEQTTQGTEGGAS